MGAEPLLELKGIEKTYPRGHRSLRVLSGVSLTVGAGETVAIVGSRYEGKTTLLNIAAGFVSPDAGEVWLAGRDLGQMSARKREKLQRENIAWVGRDGGGLQYEILDYVAMPLRMGRKPSRDTGERAMAALERMGVSGTAHSRWDDLSNWERVLVKLAQASARQPRLLVVDDLLDGLGPAKTREAGELLDSLCRESGCGVLMSVSDTDAALLADCVWVFDGRGLVLLTGPDPESNVVDLPRAGERRGRAQGDSGA
jgi:ABC-type lipoprotein export system ATPase subunit